MNFDHFPFSKDEALKQLKEGKKVRHHYFSEDEYIYMIGDKLFDESGLQLQADEFWKIRTGYVWEEGWYLY